MRAETRPLHHADVFLHTSLCVCVCVCVCVFSASTHVRVCFKRWCGFNWDLVGDKTTVRGRMRVCVCVCHTHRYVPPLIEVPSSCVWTQVGQCVARERQSQRRSHWSVCAQRENRSGRATCSHSLDPPRYVIHNHAYCAHIYTHTHAHTHTHTHAHTHTAHRIW